MKLDPGFSTDALRSIFSAGNRVGLFCQFEAVLAQAQVERGEVPAEAATAIAEVCADPPADAEEILRLGWERGTPILVLVERLRSRLGEHGEQLHRGVTTQDVVDTAGMLQCRAALTAVDDSLSSAARSLASRVETHRHSPAMGRTFLQEASPTSWGIRLARWLMSIVEARRELRRVQARLPLQLGGPVGDTMTLGSDPFELAGMMARRLDLAVADAPWHTDRWPVHETAGVAARVAATASKVAGDVALLSAWGEIRVRAGASSSMSDKRNPVDAIRAEAAAEVARTAAAGLVSAPGHALERGVGPWHAEWALLPIALQSAGAAAEAIDRCLASLEITATEQLQEPVGSDLIDRVLAAHRGLEGMT